MRDNAYNININLESVALFIAPNSDKLTEEAPLVIEVLEHYVKQSKKMYGIK